MHLFSLFNAEWIKTSVTFCATVIRIFKNKAFLNYCCHYFFNWKLKNGKKFSNNLILTITV